MKAVRQVLFASVLLFSLTAQAGFFSDLFGGSSTSTAPGGSCETDYFSKPSFLLDSNINPQVLKLALTAYQCAIQSGIQDPKQILTIVDFSLPSNAKRLWVIDLKTRKILFNSYVAHGSDSGGLWAQFFSNRRGTHESSLGLYQTSVSYNGTHQYDLKLQGLEKGFNDQAASRAIIVHGAWYVDPNFIERYGRAGRSWGCFAVPETKVKAITDTIKDGTLLFAYYPDQNWLQNSKFLHCSDPATTSSS